MELTKIETEDLIQELLNRGYVRVLWHKDDVESTAVDLGVTLTEQQIEQVIDNISHYHDANIGVNWYVIQHHIENVLQ